MLFNSPVGSEPRGPRPNADDSSCFWLGQAFGFRFFISVPSRFAFSRVVRFSCALKLFFDGGLAAGLVRLGPDALTLSFSAAAQKARIGDTGTAGPGCGVPKFHKGPPP